jgi:hypothetical protein
MAVAISTKVLQMPNGLNFRDNGDSNPCPVYLIGTDYIQQVTAASTAQQADVSGVQSIISVNYYEFNQVQTGTYYVSDSVATLLTNINAAT